MTGEERAALASRLYDVPVELVQFGMGRENDVTLIEFLQARLDEDEQWALACNPNTYADSIEEMDPAAAGHIARHDPARVLAEVEAKRRIIRLCEAGLDPDYLATPGVRAGYRLILRDLAAPYHDYPDYDQSWKPE